METQEKGEEGGGVVIPALLHIMFACFSSREWLQAKRCFNLSSRLSRFSTLIPFYLFWLVIRIHLVINERLDAGGVFDIPDDISI